MTSYLPEQVPPAARERVVEQLSRLFTNDELTEDAFESYLQRLYAATTQREIDAMGQGRKVVTGVKGRGITVAPPRRMAPRVPGRG